MPRLSMWKPNKTADYHFMDRSILEQFKIGGTGVLVHKFIGPAIGGVDDVSLPNYQAGDSDNPFGWVDETSIQDLTLLETRDRKYSDSVYELRGIYNVNDNDFDLTQFGLFLTQDTIFISFHLNDMIECLGRKLMPGDVLELPHLLDETLLDANSPPIPKFYVIQDGNRGSEGFSQTWWSHIWRAKMGPITDSQEFSNILGDAKDDDSLANAMSTYNKSLEINEKVRDAAVKNAPSYTNPSQDHLISDSDTITNTFDNTLPYGSSFPMEPNQLDKFIRDDFLPRRLFERVGTRWNKIADEGSTNDWSVTTFNAGPYIKDSTVDVSVDSRIFAERESISNPIPALPTTKDT